MKNNRYIHSTLCLIISLFCLVAMYVFPVIVKEAVLQSLLLCGRSIIPSLFPFMVITRLAVNSLNKTIPSKENDTLLPLIGLSVKGALVFVCGLISGFPTGAVLANEMYNNGCMSKHEAERITVYSSAASPSFCIIYFGGEIMNSSLYGICLYISIVMVTILLLTADHLIFRYNPNEAKSKRSGDIAIKSTSAAEIISDSCFSILNICAFVTFFMCIGRITARIASFFIPQAYNNSALICGILEFSCGTGMLAEHCFSDRILYGSLIIGFGGISAMMQIKSVCEKYGTVCKKLLTIKLLNALLTPPMLCLILCIFFRLSATVSVQYVVKYISAIVTATAVIIVFIKLIRKKDRKIIRKAKLIFKI